MHLVTHQYILEIQGVCVCEIIYPDPSRVDLTTRPKYESVLSLVGCGLESNFANDMQDKTTIYIRVRTCRVDRNQFHHLHTEILTQT